MTPDVLVLGAGLTGMSTALFLRRAGVACRVIERATRPGGHAITVEESGYRFDRTGHLLHVRDPETRRLVGAWTPGGLLELERRSAVWSHGRYTRYPFQANAHGLPPDVAYECVQGFVRAHFAPPPERPPANFEEFCLTHFGEGISRHFMIPYNARLWGVAPRDITAQWCARFVPLPSLEDVLAGAVGLDRGELGYNQRFSYPRLGIGQLSLGLADAVGEIELSKAPRSIDWRRRRVELDAEVVEYDTLVSTIPLPTLVGLLDAAPDAVRAAASKLRCTHLYYLDVALQTACEKPYHWVYIPEAKYPFYRVGCYSNFSTAMAPPNCASLYVELSDRQEPSLPALLPVVADGLVEMGLIRHREAIRFARVRRIDHAYVIFDHAYYGALEVIRPFLAEHGIVSTGRYGGWNYSSMEDALHFGRDAAHEILVSRGFSPDALASDEGAPA